MRSGRRRWAARSLTGAAALTTAHLAPGLASIAPLRRRLLPRLHGLGDLGHVALTFDDGPDARSTPLILDALADLGWRATFFMLGTMADRAPSLAREVLEAGHEIGLHGHRHRSHLLRCPSDVVEDVRRGYDVVAEATGSPPRWFRPPYGALSAATLYATSDVGLETVLWSAWGRDWRADATPTTVIADIERGMVPGATILLHDSDCTSAPLCWRSAVGALPLLSDRLAMRGLAAGPLADHALVSASNPDGGSR